MIAVLISVQDLLIWRNSLRRGDGQRGEVIEEKPLRFELHGVNLSAAEG